LIWLQLATSGNEKEKKEKKMGGAIDFVLEIYIHLSRRFPYSKKIAPPIFFLFFVSGSANSAQINLVYAVFDNLSALPCVFTIFSTISVRFSSIFVRFLQFFRCYLAFHELSWYTRLAFHELSFHELSWYTRLPFHELAFHEMSFHELAFHELSFHDLP
jgi:hypothetical protein